MMEKVNIFEVRRGNWPYETPKHKYGGIDMTAVLFYGQWPMLVIVAYAHVTNPAQPKQSIVIRYEWYLDLVDGQTPKLDTEHKGFMWLDAEEFQIKGTEDRTGWNFQDGEWDDCNNYTPDPRMEELNQLALKAIVYHFDFGIAVYHEVLEQAYRQFYIDRAKNSILYCEKQLLAANEKFYEAVDMRPSFYV